MLKKSILIGAAILGLSGIALANGGDNAAAMPAAASSDFNPGIYLGIQGGYGLSGWNNLEDEYKVSSENSLAGRVFAGYDFTKNWAIELGYTLFGSKATIKDTTETTQYAKVKTQAFDLVGKMKVPFDNGFGVYAKAGLGYLKSTGLRDLSSGTDYLFKDSSLDHVGLVYGLGVSYDITSNVIADLSWTRFNGESSLNTEATGTAADFTKYQPNADFYAIGIAYKFDMT